MSGPRQGPSTFSYPYKERNSAASLSNPFHPKPGEEAEAWLEEVNTREGTPPQLLLLVGRGCLSGKPLVNMEAPWSGDLGSRCAVGGISTSLRVSPSSLRLPFHQRTYVLGLPKDLALREEVKAMMEKGAVEVVMEQSPGFYSRIFLVDKASGA